MEAISGHKTLQQSAVEDAERLIQAGQWMKQSPEAARD